MEDYVKWLLELEGFPSSLSFSSPKKSLVVMILALEYKTSNSSGTKIGCSSVFLGFIVFFFFFPLDCIVTTTEKISFRTFWENFSK